MPIRRRRKKNSFFLSLDKSWCQAYVVARAKTLQPQERSENSWQTLSNFERSIQLRNSLWRPKPLELLMKLGMMILTDSREYSNLIVPRDCLIVLLDTDKLSLSDFWPMHRQFRQLEDVFGLILQARQVRHRKFPYILTFYQRARWFFPVSSDNLDCEQWGHLEVWVDAGKVLPGAFSSWSREYFIDLVRAGRQSYFSLLVVFLPHFLLTYLKLVSSSSRLYSL